VLLLMRKKLALPVLVVSFVCMVVTMIHNYGIAGGTDILGATGVFFAGVVFIISLALVLYTRAMAKKGVLV
jgi:hypothetical protein